MRHAVSAQSFGLGRPSVFFFTAVPSPLIVGDFSWRSCRKPHSDVATIPDSAYALLVPLAQRIEARAVPEARRLSGLDLPATVPDAPRSHAGSERVAPWRHL